MLNVNLIYYKYYNAKTAKAIAPSKIPFYDFTIVFGGELNYEINGESVTVREGDCILMPPQSLRKRAFGEKLTEYVSFNFLTKDAVELPLVTRNAVKNEIKHIVYACNAYKDPFEARANEIISGLCVAALNAVALNAENGKFSEITAAVMAFIQKNYAKPLSLKSICAEIGYSPTYSDGIFRKDAGRPIIDFLLETRISKAKELLIENSLSLCEIAERTGFNDYNYFSRLFKKRAGCSPVRYRQKFNKR